MPVRAAASAASGWQMTGQVGGPTQGIAVQGNYAFLGVGPRLVVVDLADPANPHQVAAGAVLDDLVRGVAVSGALAYVAAGADGLRVVDISDPASPAAIGAWDSSGIAEGVAVAGGVAYLADGPFGLRVLDVKNPAAPVEMSHAFEMNYVYDVALSGGYGYLAAGGAGLLVVDISTPACPVEMGGYDTPGNARAVAVLDNRAYVADERYGLQILDVADPLHPQLLGSLQTYGWAFDVAVSGSTAYLAAAFGGLCIVDVLDPAHPREFDTLSWAQSHAASLAVGGGRVYIADRKNGLRVIGGSDPAHPAQIGILNLFQFARMVVTAGETAYVAAGYNGVRILDIRDPSQPVEVGAYPIDGIVYMLRLAGSRLYAGTFGLSPAWGVYLLDVSDPLHPQQLSYGDWCGECRGIDAVGNIGYFGDSNGVRIVDFSDPAHPQLLGDTGENTASVTVSGNLAYVPQGARLKIYDISNPAQITVRGTFEDPLGFLRQNVVLSGAVAYVNDWWGVRILSIADPAHPTELAFYPTPFETEWLALSGDRLYVAEGSYGVEVLDISNPASPLPVGRFDTLGSAQTLAITGGSLLVSDMEGGLQLYPLAAAPAPPSTEAHQPEAELGPRTVPPPSRPARQMPPASTQALAAFPTAPDRPATTCTVTSAADSGPGTLRECLRNQVSGDLITFSPVVFPPSAPVTIHLGAERLDWLVRGNVTLDASNAGVILDGTHVTGEWDPGIGIASDNNTVHGLQIYNFRGPAIDLHGNHNIIGGSRLIGSGPTGQGNVLSASRLGIAIADQGNQVLGNIIGLDDTGTQAMGNEVGIGISGQNNIIGSLEAGKSNIISASAFEGVGLCHHTDGGNQIIGNYIGTDISGTLDRGNTGIGVYVECGAYDTLVQGNLISANHGGGVFVSDYASDFNVITGNRIGVTRDGAQSLPNRGAGILVSWGAYTRIGGAAPGEGNLVGTGIVEVSTGLGGDTLVQANRVGLNAAGTAVLPHAGGVVLSCSAPTIVGGATRAEANTVTAAGNFGLDIRSANNAILGNRFGLAVDGLTPLSTAGFQVLSQRDGNVIQSNRIANATSAGIWLDGAQANTIRRNSIYANPFKGIFLDNGSNHNLPAPSFSLSAAGGSGTTCPNCTVELFLDAGNQGRFFLDSLVAGEDGAFSFPARCPLPYPNLTATATDRQGNTSEFSAPQLVPWDCAAARPVPVLAAIAPDSTQAPSPTLLLQVTGADFTPDSVVRWNGQGLPATYVSAAQLLAVVPSYLLQRGGESLASVFTPSPGGGESASLPFTILPGWRTYLPFVTR